MDRVAIVGCFWFVAWIVAGLEIGKFLNSPGTGCVWGFSLALATIFAWPWVMPRRLDDWMHDHWPRT